jgi:hypothetical protein
MKWNGYSGQEGNRRMTATPDESYSDPIQRMQDLDELRRLVEAMLAGSGLRIEAQKYELVITKPGESWNGQIRIRYVDGLVSRTMKSVNRWGPLRGYKDDGKGTKPPIGADEIISTLRGIKRE